MGRARGRVSRLFVVVAASTLALAGLPVTGTTADTAVDPAARRIVSGWLRPQYMSDALASVRANDDLWRDASPFWYSASSATTINGSGVDPTVVDTLQSLGVPVLPTVTEGMNTPAMESMLANPTTRAAHRNALVDLVVDNGYDGIDLDYENMNFGGTTAQKAHVASLFVTFLDGLQAALTAQGKLLSVTVGPRTSGTDPNWAVFDYAGIGGNVDLFRVMTYDYHYRGGPPGAIAPVGWVDTVLSYVVSVVPAGKVQVGVPLYGYDWPKNPDGTWGTASSLSTYEAAEALRTSVGAARQWSSAAAAPFFTYTRNGVDHVVWYNDSQSTRAKTAFVGDLGLRGMVFWHVAQEDTRQWPAIRAYATPDQPLLTASAPAAVTHGTQVTVTGRLADSSGSPITGATVHLGRRTATATTWTRAATGTTSATGQVAFTYTPSVNGDFRLRAPGSWRYVEALSAPVTTLVRFRVTAAFGDATVTRGTTVRLRGTVDPARAGTSVERQRLVNGTWTTIASGTVSASGSYSFSWVPNRAGTYSHRVRVPGTTLNTTGFSPTLTLRVS